MTAIDLGWLGLRLRERNLAEGSVLTIADRDGTLIAREPDPESFVGRPISPGFQYLVAAERPGTAELVSPDGTRRIVGYQPPSATGTGLYVATGVSKQGAFAPIYAATWRTLALAASGALAACLVAWFVGDRLFRQPIRRILATIASWRAGDKRPAPASLPTRASSPSSPPRSTSYMDNLALVRGERAAAEQRRSLLLREMNHRIKNVLAAVQAIANQTFKDRGHPGQHAHLRQPARGDGRLPTTFSSPSNGRAPTCTRPSPPRSHPSSSVAGAASSSMARRRRSAPRAALSMSMALHELCTNAAKYGALSTPAGLVSVRWWLAEAEPGPRFCFTWTESGGPPVAAPERAGFGTRLIETALASELSGSARLEYSKSGVTFTLDADATQVLSGDRPASLEGTAA